MMVQQNYIYYVGDLAVSVKQNKYGYLLKNSMLIVQIIKVHINTLHPSWISDNPKVYIIITIVITLPQLIVISCAKSLQKKIYQNKIKNTLWSYDQFANILTEWYMKRKDVRRKEARKLVSSADI